MSELSDISDRLNAAADRADAASQIIHDVANGDENTQVLTENGALDSLARLQKRIETEIGDNTSVSPAPNKIPLSDESGQIDFEWVKGLSKFSDIRNFGGLSDGVTDDTEAWVKAWSDAQLGSGIVIGNPKSLVTGPVGKNSITPTLVRSKRGTILSILDGSEDTPVKTDDPSIFVQKNVKFTSPGDRYRQSPLALFEVVASGSGGETPNDGSWAGVWGNARLKNKNIGTQSSPATDANGSLTGVVGFAKADFYPGNGTAQTALWGYASTIDATDSEFDALAASGVGWAAIGLEINLQINHKDVGYRENIAGASTTVGAWLHNYRSNTLSPRNWNFGAVVDGGIINKDQPDNVSTNYSSHYVGMKIDHSKRYGILMGRKMAPSSIFIKGADSHLLSDGRPLAIMDTGDNPIIMGGYTGQTFLDGMLWQKDGSLNFRKAGVNREILLNGEKAFFGTIANQVNRLEFYGGAAGQTSAVVAGGSDANRSLELRTFGSGRVWLGPYAAQATQTAIGYIEVKDSTGVTRKLAVIS